MVFIIKFIRFNLIEWRSAGQEISRNAKGSRNCREGFGKSERRIRQECRRDREAIAAGSDDTGGAKLQGKTDQRSSRVSISNDDENTSELEPITK